MIDKVTFHVLSIPHTITSKNYLACAYTQKVLNLCLMLEKMDATFFHYGNAGASVKNHVTTIPQELYDRVYGQYDWHSNFFKFDQNDEVYRHYYAETAKQIESRAGKLNFILCPWGWGNKPVLDRLHDGNGKKYIAIESGIGYESTFSQFRVFESYAWMHHVYGMQREGNIKYYDAVIPNYYDVNDFDSSLSFEKDDYILYLGRLIPRKGISILMDMARLRPSMKFILAGQGNLAEFNPPPNCEHVGYADLEKRRKLLSKAKALVAPTIYHEPFGGVTVEALLSGTPIITTDVGAFTETNINGVTGYRFRTLSEADTAVGEVLRGAISPKQCRDYAVANFSLETVMWKYHDYFERVSEIFTGGGWYSAGPVSLDRFSKTMP